MAEKKQYMTQAEYARHRSVSRARITQLIQSGSLTTVQGKDGTKLIDVEAADKQLEANTFVGNQRAEDGDSVIAKENAEPSAGTSYAKSRAVRETALARLAHLELQRKMGNLVDAKAVELQAFADGRKIRNAITAIPDRVAPILAAESDVTRIHAILAKEIHSTLKGLAIELGESV